jgi:tRNA1(Val) A37 N6-methylase TrmN6
MSTGNLTLDRFLDGRVIAAQPAGGFRAGHDTVLLAAAVPAEANSVALELGSGVGVASLCLAARVPGVRITGIEIDPELVRLANENAARNGVADRVSFLTADAAKSSLKAASADHVFLNPPFHPPSGHQSPSRTRDVATRDTGGTVAQWTEQALAFARDGGTVTAIVRYDRVDEVLAAARSYGGVVFPLFPREGAKPKRAIVRILKIKPVSLAAKSDQSLTFLPSPLEGEDARGAAKPRACGRKGGDHPIRSVCTKDSAAFSAASGLILHEADGKNTEAAERVLRHAEALW